MNKEDTRKLGLVLFIFALGFWAAGEYPAMLVAGACGLVCVYL